MVEVQRRERAGYRVLLIVLWLTLLILAIQGWVGWATRSLSLLADALHILVDCFSTLLSLGAVLSLPSTKGYEIRGHRGGETAAILLVVGFLGFLGFNLLGVAVYQFQALLKNASILPAIQIDLPLILLLCVVSAVHICLVLYERYESGVLEISALRHNANHILHDFWLTILMLLGLLGVSQGYVWLDSLMAIVLILMLIPSIWRVVNWQVPSMAYQVAIAPELLTHLAMQIEGVAECQRVRSCGMVGRSILVQMHLRVHPEFVNMAHLITERLEGVLREHYGVVQAKIYIYPKGSPPRKSK